jgi:hypothetical protein
MVSYKDVLQSWDRFFFTPKPTEGIALFRIIWCAMLALSFLFEIQNIHDFYGPHSLISLKTVKEQFSSVHMNIFNLFHSGYEAVYIILTIYGLALISAMLGFYTRSSLLIILICLTSIHQRNIWLLSSSELLIRSITILLVCAPCGHSLSLDSLLGRKYLDFRRPRDWAPWALRLIQIQVSVVYLWTVWHKLKGDTWFDGTALYYATRLESMTNFPVPFLLDSMAFLMLATWGAIITELALGILVWFKEFRKPVIMAGIIFHVSIEYMMSIPFFEIVMITLLLNFYTPEEYRNFVTRVKAKILMLVKEANVHASVKEKFIWAIQDED